MTRNKVEPKKVGNREEAMHELEEFILNHLKYDDNFVVIRMVISQQTPMNSEKEIKMNAAMSRKLSDAFRHGIRSEDYVGKLAEQEYLMIIKDNNPANGILVANRLSRIVSDMTNGQYIGRTYVTPYQNGDNTSTLMERLLH